MTDSEKLLGDTLRKLEHEGTIQWGHKLEAQVRNNFRTPAPIDFLIVHNDRYYPVEVKEQGRNSIPFGHFKDEQRRLLHELPNALVLLRYFSADYNRNNFHYFEHYILARGEDWCPKLGEKGGLKLKDLLQSEEIIQLASHQNGVKKGFGDEAGLTTRDNLITGLENLIDALEVLTTGG